MLQPLFEDLKDLEGALATDARHRLDKSLETLTRQMSTEQWPKVLRRHWDGHQWVETMEPDCPEDVKNIVVQRLVRKRVIDQTLLDYAIQKRWAGLVEWCLRHGYDANRFNTWATPAGAAIYAGMVDVVRVMRDWGADLQMTLREEHQPKEGELGCTALHRAMRRSFPQKAAMIALLAEAYPDPLVQNALGETPIDWAIDHVGVAEIKAVVAAREQQALQAWQNDRLSMSTEREGVARPRL